MASLSRLSIACCSLAPVPLAPASVHACLCSSRQACHALGQLKHVDLLLFVESIDMVLQVQLAAARTGEDACCHRTCCCHKLKWQGSCMQHARDRCVPHHGIRRVATPCYTIMCCCHADTNHRYLSAVPKSHSKFDGLPLCMHLLFWPKPLDLQNTVPAGPGSKPSQ